MHDSILFYTKSDAWTWNRPYAPNREEYIAQNYTKEDQWGRYRIDNLTAPGVSHGGESGQEWRGVNPSTRGKGRHWYTPTEGEMCAFIVDNDIIPDWPAA